MAEKVWLKSLKVQKGNENKYYTQEKTEERRYFSEFLPTVSRITGLLLFQVVNPLILYLLALKQGPEKVVDSWTIENYVTYLAHRPENNIPKSALTIY